jgi:anaerobic selenocysteine-containing dehydrogenase
MIEFNPNNRYSKSSADKLEGAAVPLQNIFRELLHYLDHGIIETERSDEKQLELYNSGLSHIKSGGKHNQSPSRAVDFYLWYAPFKTYLTTDQKVLDKITSITGSSEEEVREWIRSMYGMAYALLSLFAQAEGVTIRWGGKWNKHGIIDQEFDDFFHIELVD